jgi:hypothetical protein
MKKVQEDKCTNIEHITVAINPLHWRICTPNPSYYDSKFVLQKGCCGYMQ